MEQASPYAFPWSMQNTIAPRAHKSVYCNTLLLARTILCVRARIRPACTRIIKPQHRLEFTTVSFTSMANRDEGVSTHSYSPPSILHIRYRLELHHDAQPHTFRIRQSFLSFFAFCSGCGSASESNMKNDRQGPLQPETL